MLPPAPFSHRQVRGCSHHHVAIFRRGSTRSHRGATICALHGVFAQIVRCFSRESFELALSVCATSLFTVSCDRVPKSRGFAPACPKHAMHLFWPPHLVCRFRAMHTPFCICGFSSCRGVCVPRFTIHFSQQLSVPSLVLWASPDGSAPANSRWRTPAVST